MRIALVVALVGAVPVALLAPTAAAAQATVDWQQKVVKCTGSGSPNLQAAGGVPAQARIGAERAAKLDALRNCMEALKGVQLSSGQKVGDALAGDAALKAQVEGIVKGFKVVGKPRYFSDGGVELDVEVPMEGALSDALLPKAPEGQAQPKPASADASPAGTSLVVDARGLKVTPAIAPRVLDESGKEVYGPAMLSEQGRKAGGGAGYAKDLEAAKKDFAARLGDKPLVVKAVKADGADLVVPAAELAGKNLSFLADAKVVILADAPAPAAPTKGDKR